MDVTKFEFDFDYMIGQFVGEVHDTTVNCS